jgi:phosphoribosylpyrophosphate synthetase
MLFYHSSMESLAISIAQLVQKRLHDGLRSVELSDAIQWRRFRDGWPNIFINNVGEVAGRDVIFVASFHSPEVIFEQLSLIYSFPRYFVRSFRLILPFFPTATMERVDYEGQIVTAKVNNH